MNAPKFELGERVRWSGDGKVGTVTAIRINQGNSQWFYMVQFDAIKIGTLGISEGGLSHYGDPAVCLHCRGAGVVKCPNCKGNGKVSISC